MNLDVETGSGRLAPGERMNREFPFRSVLKTDIPRGDLGNSGENKERLVTTDLGSFAFTVLKSAPEGEFVRTLMNDLRSGFLRSSGGSGSKASIPTIPLPAGIWMMLAGLAIIVGGWRFRGRRRGRHDAAANSAA